MIKSNRNIKEIIPFNRLVPMHAEGHFCLDLTDPVTGKVKESVKGKNTVFPEQLFMGTYGGSGSFGGISDYSGFVWNSAGMGINRAILALNDDGTAPDINFTYLRGQTVGYGRPSSGSLGTYRGAYNSANQVLGEASLTKQRWKFQYDFTTAQANVGTIRVAGLTKQYHSVYGGFTGATKHSVYANDDMASAIAQCTSDGRYCAYIDHSSTTGIVKVFDMNFGSRTDIDLSSIVGTSSSEKKAVGYAPATGKWYIYRYSGTTSNRKVWVFTDQTFSNLETTYTVTNIAVSLSQITPFYVYGDVMYLLTTSDNPWIQLANFVSNTAATSRTFSWSTFKNNALYNEGLTSVSMSSAYGSIGIEEGIYIFNSYQTAGLLYDAVNDVSKATFYGKGLDVNLAPVCFHPLLTGKIPCNIGNSSKRIGALQGALTQYVLPTPVAKTSANGMSVTYELEVFW
jgi:hypothetical protein